MGCNILLIRLIFLASFLHSLSLYGCSLCTLYGFQKDTCALPNELQVIIATELLEKKPEILYPLIHTKPLATLEYQTNDLAEFSRFLGEKRNELIRAGDITPLSLQLKDEQNYLNSITFIDEKTFAATSLDQMLYVWNIEDSDTFRFNPLQATHAQNEKFSTQIAISPDKTMIATTSHFTPDIKIWKHSSLSSDEGMEMLATLSGHTGTPKSLKFTGDSKRLLSCALDGTARIWNIEQRDVEKLYSHPPANLFSWRLPADDKEYVDCLRSRCIMSFDSSSDHKSSAVLDGGCRLYVWQEGSLEPCIKQFPMNEKDDVREDGFQLYQVYFINNDTQLLIIGWNPLTLFTVDLATKKVATMATTISISSFRYNATTKMATLSLCNGRAARYDTTKNKLITIFHGHSDEVLQADSNLEETLMVTVSKDLMLKVWPLQNDTLYLSTKQLLFLQYLYDLKQELTKIDDAPQQLLFNDQALKKDLEEAFSSFSGYLRQSIINTYFKYFYEHNIFFKLDCKIRD